MRRRVTGSIASACLFYFFFTIFVPNLYAEDYSYIYKFGRPIIKYLDNGLQIIEFEDTMQNDSIIGAPLMPVRRAKIYIPAEENVTSVRVVPGARIAVQGRYTIQHATEPYPISFHGPIEPTQPDADIYSKNANYPLVSHAKRGSQYLCGSQIVIVDLNPAIYNPVRHEVRYYEHIKVIIHTTHGTRPKGVRPFRNSPLDRKQILRSIDNRNNFLRVNPKLRDGLLSNSVISSTDMMTAAPAAARDYVVITTSDMISAFAGLTSHRQSAEGGGFTTHIEDISNILSSYSGVDDAEKIRNFIIDMYNNYGTKYVVLGGDCDGEHGTQTLSTRGCHVGLSSYTDDYIPTDLYFGCLDGTWNDNGNALWGESDDGIGGGDIDWESEVYVGRIPADNATEAATQINKIIAYETGSNPLQTLLVGQKMDSTPTWGGDRMDYIYAYMGFTPKTELYDRNYDPDTWPKSDLLAYINSNDYSWLNNLGHGSENYNMKLGNSDVLSMTNTKYFFLYTQACYSGSIDSRRPNGSYTSECILEDMVNKNNHGAFAIIGNSRYGWYSSGGAILGQSNWAHKDFTEAVFIDGYTRLGDANQISKAQLPVFSNVYRWIAFETNLLGCPATELKTESIGKQVLWDQPVGGTINGSVCQDFETSNNALDKWTADDFTNDKTWAIYTIRVPGTTFMGICGLDSASSLNFYIYSDDSGIPAGYPDGGLGGSGLPVWSLSVPSTDPQVSLSRGARGYQTNVTLNLTNPINLPPGTYWFLFYPELDYSEDYCEYGSHVSATTNGYEGKTINPGDGFGKGATSWTDMTDFHDDSISQTDWAFRLEGIAKNSGFQPWILLLLVD